ncbi:hypothetical protein Tco_0695576 [Tanacetum coccineum]
MAGQTTAYKGAGVFIHMARPPFLDKDKRDDHKGDAMTDKSGCQQRQRNISYRIQLSIFIPQQDRQLLINQLLISTLIVSEYEVKASRSSTDPEIWEILKAKASLDWLIEYSMIGFHIRRIACSGYRVLSWDRDSLNVDQGFIFGVSDELDMAYSSKSGNGLEFV